MKENIIIEKSYQFALRIIKLYLHLTETTKHFALANQVLKSGTSIGANAEEAIGASSRKDFKSKFDIAYREARETKYWLKLLRDSIILEEKLANSLIDDCEELIKILGAILSTIRKETQQ
ncbi:MAG TPA: four helix bundle protein [Chitinophagaceae bacterium]|nr:four helix bundle protein [Chitinophagaceae bacterium]